MVIIIFARLTVVYEIQFSFRFKFRIKRERVLMVIYERNVYVRSARIKIYTATAGASV